MYFTVDYAFNLIFPLGFLGKIQYVQYVHLNNAFMHCLNIMCSFSRPSFAKICSSEDQKRHKNSKLATGG